MENDYRAVEFIRNPTKKVECEAFKKMTEDECFFGFYFPKTSIFHSFIIPSRVFFLRKLPLYKEELITPICFQSLLSFLSSEKRYMDWNSETVRILEPLTKEQQDIWNKIRLQTIV